MLAREELNRHLAIAGLTAPAALLVWWVFHGVYVSLSESARAVGYIEPTTQAGIYFGYLVMVVGTTCLGFIAARSALVCAALLLRQRK